MSCQVRPADSGRYPSGQRGQTVNLLAYAFGGSNPPLPTIVASALRPDQTEGGLREARLREARAIGRLSGVPRLREARAIGRLSGVPRLREARAIRRLSGVPRLRE